MDTGGQGKLRSRWNRWKIQPLVASFRTNIYTYYVHRCLFIHLFMGLYIRHCIVYISPVHSEYIYIYIVCVYICICSHICVYMFTYIHVHICIIIYIYTHFFICVHSVHVHA